MADRPFDAVIFDFGGVVATSPFAQIELAGERMGLAPGVFSALLLGPYDEDGDHPWHRLERGEITLADYGIDLLVRAQAEGIDLSGGAGGSILGAMRAQDAVVERIRRLREQGYATALLTNNIREAGVEWRAMAPLDELFDVVVDSCEVGMRKPNPAIYRHTLDLLGVAAERSVFLDDAPGNVLGARAVGLAAILVDDAGVALAALDALLGP